MLQKFQNGKLNPSLTIKNPAQFQQVYNNFYNIFHPDLKQSPMYSEEFIKKNSISSVKKSSSQANSPMHRSKFEESADELKKMLKEKNEFIKCLTQEKVFLLKKLKNQNKALEDLTKQNYELITVLKSHNINNTYESDKNITLNDTEPNIKHTKAHENLNENNDSIIHTLDYDKSGNNSYYIPFQNRSIKHILPTNKSTNSNSLNVSAIQSLKKKRSLSSMPINKQENEISIMNNLFTCNNENENTLNFPLKTHYDLNEYKKMFDDVKNKTNFLFGKYENIVRKRFKD